MVSSHPERIPIGLACRMLGVSTETLRRWARQGRLRCWRGPGGRRYFDPAELPSLMRPDAEANKRRSGRDQVAE